jgi:hypothetical protein
MAFGIWLAATHGVHAWSGWSVESIDSRPASHDGSEPPQHGDDPLGCPSADLYDYSHFPHPSFCHRPTEKERRKKDTSARRSRHEIRLP